MDQIDLCYLTGQAALAAFAEGLHPRRIVEAQLARATEHDARLRAFTEIYADDALDAADRAAEAWAAGRARPLEGLTLAVKDSHDLAGRRTTHASLPYNDTIADTTHPAVERLLAAGAIPIGKTTTPEFCTAGVTVSRLFGVTPTPWDTRWTAGGSSGGSAAALAAGMTTLATGSDIAGSIRVPAACCGVVGYKPPYGRVPNGQPLNLEPYCQSGPMARSVQDCALMTAVMAGTHPEDMATLRDTPDLDSGEDVSGAVIAVSPDLGFAAVAPEVQQALEAAARRLANRGARIEEVRLPWGPEVTEAAVAYLDHRLGPGLAAEVTAHGEQLCDYTRWYAEKAAPADAASAWASIDTVNRMYSEIAPVLERADALLCPTVGTGRVPADAMPWEEVEIAGRTVDADFGWVLTHPFNMLNRLPVIAIPTGRYGDGLPIGLQVVGRSYDDARAFRVARAIEADFKLYGPHARPTF